MIKVLHCADLHLDSPFSSLSQKKSEERREEQRELLRNLVCYIRNSHIDLVLISGDLFDSGFTSPKMLKYAEDLFANLDCPVVIAPGNHDPYIEGGIYSSAFSKNVHIYKSKDISSFDFESLGVTVYGYAFTSSSYEEHPLEQKVNVNADRVNILCAHADTAQALSKYAPITPRQLDDCPFDYVALGHIHNAPQIENRNGTIVAYPGCAEGRSFDELDFGGAILLEIDNKSIKHERVVLAKRRYMSETVDITGIDNDDAVIEKISGIVSVKGFGEETSLRVVLNGAVSSEYTPNEKRITESLDKLYSAEIVDDTLPILDEKMLETDVSVRGEFYRTLLKTIKEGSDDERKTAVTALRLGLSALDDKPIIL